MKTKKIFLLTLACLAASPILNSCKSKIIEPDPDQKQDTTNITVSRIPKKITLYGRSKDRETCATCKEEQALTYDVHGNLSKNVSTFYDGSTLTKQEETNYEWNNGNLVKKTTTGIIPSKQAITATYSYNALGKIAKIIDPSAYAPTTNYYYSEEGKLVTVVSEEDSVHVEETDSSLYEYKYRRHHPDRSWVPSVDYIWTKRGKVMTMHEIGYSVTPNKEVSIFTESTAQETFSDIPYSKQLQMVDFTPADHKLYRYDFFPISTSRITTWEGETTTDQCTYEIILDNLNRVKNWNLPCDDMNIYIEY